VTGLTLPQLADAHVGIAQALVWAGASNVPESPEGRPSGKFHCPFELTEHDDQGAEAAMRWYADSNSAYCFACQAYYRPVSLLAAAWEMDPDDAAAEALRRVRYKPATYAHLWASVSRDPAAEVDTMALAKAFKVYAFRVVPGWGELQYEDDVAEFVGRCLRLLGRAVSTPAQGELWLRRCKASLVTFMERRDGRGAGEGSRAVPAP
jgi:hypothetical protein